MTADRIIAECRSYRQLIAGMRAWVAELGVTFDSIDALALQPDRYTSKVLMPRPKKIFGEQSFDSIMGAIGLKLLLVVDDEQLARVKDRLVQRTHLGASLDSTVNLSFSRRHYRTIGAKGGKARPPLTKAHYASAGRIGGQKRMKMLSKEQRRMLSLRANRMRWAPKHGDPMAGISETG